MEKRNTSISQPPSQLAAVTRHGSSPCDVDGSLGVGIPSHCKKAKLPREKTCLILTLFFCLEHGCEAWGCSSPIVNMQHKARNQTWRSRRRGNDCACLGIMAPLCHLWIAHPWAAYVRSHLRQFKPWMFGFLLYAARRVSTNRVILLRIKAPVSTQEEEGVRFHKTIGVLQTCVRRHTRGIGSYFPFYNQPQPSLNFAICPQLGLRQVLL